MQLVPPNGVGYFSVALNFTQPQGEDVWASDGGPDPSILEETLAVTYPDVVSGAAVPWVASSYRRSHTPCAFQQAKHRQALHLNGAKFKVHLDLEACVEPALAPCVETVLLDAAVIVGERLSKADSA